MMMPTDLSTQIINALTGINQPGGINILWTTVCTYIMANAEVPFVWNGVSSTTPPVPEVIISTAKINTSAGMTLDLSSIENAQTAADAMGILSTAINSAIARWTILFPIEQGFTIPTYPVIPTPVVVLTPSGATNQRSAMDLLCEQIINGVKLLQFQGAPAPNTFMGTHLGVLGLCTGTAVFTPLTIV